MIAWSAPSPSRPAPSARRYAALGLDRSASLSLPMVESPPVSGADPLPYSSTRRSGGHALDAIFMLERSINGLSPEERLAARRRDIVPLVDDLIDCRFEIHLDPAQARIECDRVRF